MPVIATTAYPKLGDVFTFVRSLMNDVAGNVFTDAVLLPYANSAYRKVNAALGNIQAASYIKDNYQITVAAISAVDPGTQVPILDSTAPPNQLPPDLLVPLKLWERPNGSTDSFQEMIDLTDGGGLPSIGQGQALRFWEWRTDGIYLIGATQDIQIRLRYEAAYLDMTDANSPLLIRNGQNAISFKTAELAAAARGAPQSALWKESFEEALETMKSRATMREQSRPRRRRPYSSRTGDPSIY